MPFRTFARTKHARSLSAVLLPALLATAVLLAGCGGVEGKYSHEEEIPDGGGTAKVTLQLAGSNKATLTMSGGALGGAMSVEGTYEVDGDQVAVTIDGDKEVFTRKGNKLVGSAFGDSVELVKE